ncbi:hypothetical protein OV203_21190 [Nannocystis sp. ILAH1]|uniref:RCC1 domain-containing protein n=1 Tax=Nannocystis sp. ILAH1 TaxID=2996789 RepID=UPI00226E0DD0|nr:hypothetical protein [Nannocystis sp. ILAH1]MCY0989667.1 hypothetical protein [Nannocystis sp. ILAH1]
MPRALVSLLVMSACARETAVDPVVPEKARQAPAEAPARGVAPATVVGLRATAIAVGGATSYARMIDGTVRGWGDGARFALGREDAAAVSYPLAIAGVARATAVFAGGTDMATACATIDDGRVLCWGARRGFPLTRELSVEGVPATEVPALAGAREITIGSGFGCALMADETVRCWGGVPGWVELPRQREPEPVPGLDGVVSVRAGWSYVCALGKDGRVRCWGKNYALQVVPSESKSFVAKVPTVVAGVEDAVELAVAQHFGAARLGDGTLRVWGGEAPVDVSPGRVSPLALAGTPVALSSSGVGSHVCAIAERGTVQCVGYNRYGQLGVPPGQRFAAKTMVAVPQLTDAVAVATSQNHSCALVRDGNVWCWGGNSRGGLGDGTLSDTPEPRPVAHLLDITPLPPSPPRLVDDGPVESYEGLPEGCAHPTLALTLPGRERTDFAVKSAYARIADDGKTASIHLRDHGFDVAKTFWYEPPRGDRLHLELVLTHTKTVKQQRRDPATQRVIHSEWVKLPLKLKPGVHRTFAAWLALDSPGAWSSVEFMLTAADRPILLEASPVRGADTQEVTITRLGPDWICGALAVSSPRGTLTGEFAARVHSP